MCITHFKYSLLCTSRTSVFVSSTLLVIGWYKKECWKVLLNVDNFLQLQKMEK